MNRPDDTALIERDLDAVDAALAGETASADDPITRELQQLALALRADSPVPDPGYAQELRGRVEAGFPRAGSTRARRRAALERLSPRRNRRVWTVLRPAIGVGAPLLLVVAIALSVGDPSGRNGGDDEEGGGGGSVAEAPLASGGDSGGGGGAEAAPEAGSSPSEQSAARSSGDTAVTPSPGIVDQQLPGSGFAPGRRERKIERSISMTLTAPNAEIPALAGGVNRVTARHGGFVLRSELDTNESGATGSFELRIPSNQLQGALADLAKLGTVSSQSQAGQDVTREQVTAVDRLQAARAERRSLLRRLEAATTDIEAESIRRRLDLVAGEINGLRTQLRDLRLRTDYATVSVDLIGDDDPSNDEGGGAGSFDDAVGDAGDLLVGFAGVLVRVLAIALPLGLIAGIGWLAGHVLRRRRRESALA